MCIIIISIVQRIATLRWEKYIARDFTYYCAILPCASFGFVTLANVPLEWAASFGFALCSVQRIVDCKPQMCRIVFGALLCRALQTVPLRSADGILFCIFVYLCVCVFAYCRICICVIAYWCICSLYCAAHRMLHP